MGSSLKFDGNVESLENGYVRGWAYCTTDPAIKVEVDLLLDNEVVGRKVANLMRDDLKWAGKGNGEHGFRILLPVDSVSDRFHILSVRVHGNGQQLGPTIVLSKSDIEKNRSIELPIGAFPVVSDISRNASGGRLVTLDAGAFRAFFGKFV